MLNLNETTIDAYKQKIEAEVKEMKAKMKLQEANAEKSSADMRIKFQKNQDDLKSRFKDIEMRLDRFSNSAEDSWGEIRSGIDKSMDEMRDALKNATKHLNN